MIDKIKRTFSNLLAKKITFEDVAKQKNIYLYAGNVPNKPEYKKYVGLSINQANENHIKHDVTKPYPLSNNCVDIYQSEDVFEHIELDALPNVINEIYRTLKLGGIFRLSLPDYGCDLLQGRTQKDEKGDLMFDPIGGGSFINGKVTKGGHLWFPDYEKVKSLFEKTNFKNVTFLHYYDEIGTPVTHKIDYSIGMVMRTPDHDERVKNPYRPLSIVVDSVK